MVKRIISFFLLLIILAGAGFYIYLSRTYPYTPPFTSTQYFLENLINPHAKLDKHVLGFLPYWQVDTITYLKPERLSEINYFSLNVGDDGHLLTTTNGQTDPGWREWQKPAIKNLITKAHIDGTDVSLTVAALDNTLITDILNSDAAQQNLINDTLNVVNSRNLDAVNIDFEYSGTPDAGDQEKFTAFSSQLKKILNQKSSHTKLSLSIMPLSARDPGLFDLQQLAPIYDTFIGMSYEYYGANSEIAGPIAPMNGFKEGQYFFDVTTTYEDYLKVIPKEKIIMGLPYYGWEWAVRDGATKNSSTFASSSPYSYAAVISYARAREDTDLTKSQCKWDPLAQETWCWYKDSKTGIDRQVWLMDKQAINTRFAYAKNQNFAGVAIWTLGSDKQYPDLWDMIVTMFSHQ